MRLLAAAASVLIVSAAAAEPPQSLGSRLAALSAKNPVVGWVGWAFADCVRAEAKALGEKPEPSIDDSSWVPHRYKPTPVEEVTSVMEACSFEAEALALEVSKGEMQKLRASIEDDAARTIRFERQRREIWRVE
jgi:hypothetical protein